MRAMPAIIGLARSGLALFRPDVRRGACTTKDGSPPVSRTSTTVPSSRAVISAAAAESTSSSVSRDRRVQCLGHHVRRARGILARHAGDRGQLPVQRLDILRQLHDVTMAPFLTSVKRLCDV